MTYRMRTYLHTPIELHGDHYEIGYQLGEQTANMLHERNKNQTFGTPIVPRSKWPSPAEYTVENYERREPERFAEWDKMIKTLPKWITDEMHGVADGAKVPYEKVLFDRAHFPVVFGGSHALTEDCDGFVAFGGATLGGRTIVAGNSEGTNESTRLLNVYSIKNPNGMNMVYAHNCPGCIGSRAGLNEEGLAIWGNGVSVTSDEFGYMGYDHHITRRTVLETCSNVDEAIDCLKKMQRIGGSRVFLGDRERGAVVEYTSKHISVLEPECEYQGGASPSFVIPEMAPYHYVLVDETDPKFTYGRAAKRGIFRTERFHELLKEYYGKLTPEMVPVICGDHGGRGTGLIRNTIDGAALQGSDYTICVHGSKVGDAYHTSSWGAISVPDERKMYIAWGSPCQAEFVGFCVPE